MCMCRIKSIVEKIIEKYGTNDPFKIAEQQNIIVQFEDLKEIYGFYNYFKRIKFIHINCNIDFFYQKYCCAHELGHANLHHDINTPFLKKYTLYSTDKIEVEANRFAVELLMPDKLLYENISKFDPLTIYESGQLYGVPKEFVRLKKMSI